MYDFKRPGVKFESYNIPKLCAICTKMCLTQDNISKCSPMNISKIGMQKKQNKTINNRHTESPLHFKCVRHKVSLVSPVPLLLVLGSSAAILDSFLTCL